MKNVKLSTRILTLFIIVLGIVGLFLLRNELTGPPKSIGQVFGGIFKTPAKNISVSMGKQILIPFDLLTIDGKNFDPDAATSVIFTSREKQVIVLQALSVTPSSVAVSVPPFGYDKDTGKFQMDVVSYKVVQAKKDGENLNVKTSNEISGIQVLAPAIPKVLQDTKAKKIPVGTVTRAFTAVAVRSLQDAAKKMPATSTKAIASLNAAQSAMKDLLSSLDKFIKNPNAPIKLKTSTGGTVNLDAAGIAWLDAFYSGYLGLAEQNQGLISREDPFSLIAIAHADEEDCQVTWAQGDDVVNTLIAETNCFYDRSIAVSNKAIDLVFNKDNYNSNFVLILPTIALGIATGGFSIEAQIAIGISYSLAADFAFSGGDLSAVDSLPGVLSAIGDAIIKLPEELPKGFPLLSVLTLAIKGFYESCMQTEPGICSKSKDFLSMYGDKLLYLANGVPGIIGYLFDSPNENFNGVLRAGFGAANGGYDVIQPAIAPTPVPSPAPVTPTPIVPAPNPSPNPKPKPSPPLPKPVDCSELRQSSYEKCLDACGPQPDIGIYNGCLAGCHSAIDCVNACIGSWSKLNSEHSDCYVKCLNAFNNTKCP